MSRTMSFTKMELCNSENKWLRAEVTELQAALQRTEQTINQLKEKLADKAQQLSDATVTSQKRKFAYNKRVNELKGMMEALEQIKEKHEALELKLQKELEEQDSIFKKELEEQKDSFQEKLSHLLKPHQQEFFESEEERKSQLQREDENFKRQLMELSEQWVARAQESAEKQRELEEKIRRMLEDKEVEEVDEQIELND